VWKNYCINKMESDHFNLLGLEVYDESKKTDAAEGATNIEP